MRRKEGKAVSTKSESGWKKGQGVSLGHGLMVLLQCLRAVLFLKDYKNIFKRLKKIIFNSP